MVKVLTIRDPRTGTLIAEEPIRPKEDEDSGLMSGIWCGTGFQPVSGAERHGLEACATTYGVTSYPT